MKPIAMICFLLCCCTWKIEAKQDNSTPSPISFVFSQDDFYPLVYQDVDGFCKRKGIYIDVIELIFIQQLKLDVTCHSLPWQRAQHSVKRGRYDVFFAPLTHERLSYATASQLPVYNMLMRLYSYQEHKKLSEIETIQSVDDIIALELIAVSNAGNGWYKDNVEAYGVKTVYVKSDEHMFRFLAQQRADVLIDTELSSDKVINRIGLNSQIVKTQVLVGQVDFYLLLSNKSPYLFLLPKINQAIQTLIDNGQLAKIIANYRS